MTQRSGFLSFFLLVFSSLKFFQEECLLKLQSRIDIAYDSSVPEHQVYIISWISHNDSESVVFARRVCMSLNFCCANSSLT